MAIVMNNPWGASPLTSSLWKFDLSAMTYTEVATYSKSNNLWHQSVYFTSGTTGFQLMKQVDSLVYKDYSCTVGTGNTPDYREFFSLDTGT